MKKAIISLIIYSLINTVLFAQDQSISGVLDVTSQAIPLSSTASKQANLLITASSSQRSMTEGAALGFVVPANTDGSNLWQQGRILVTPANTLNANAYGMMYLQTRKINESGAWAWQNNLVLSPSGYNGIGTASPSAPLEVKSSGTIGSTTVENFDINKSYIKVTDASGAVLGFDPNQIACTSGTLDLSVNSGNMNFRVGSTNKLRILENGNVHVYNKLTFGGDENNPVAIIDKNGFLLAEDKNIKNTNYGIETFQSNISGLYNTAFGKKALKHNTTGDGNTAIGYMSAIDNTTGNFNTAIGGYTLTEANGRENTAIGYKSQQLATGAGLNTSVGYRSLQNTSGTQNVAIGRLAMTSSTSSSQNTIIGAGAAQGTTSAYSNTGIGHYSLSGLTEGDENVAVGKSAGGITTGSRNIVIGPYTLGSSANSYNIVMGYRSSAPTGDNNIIIGKKITLPAGTSNAMNIGGVLFGADLQSDLPDVPLSTPVNGRIGIGTRAPQAKLQVNAEGDPANLEDNVNNGLMIRGTDQVLYMGANSASHVSYIQSVDYGTATAPLLLNARGGAVAIGTTTPATGYMLSVAGGIMATEVKVELTEAWPDYVFEKDYKLPSLQEVEEHIQENGHLKDIPSADCVEGNGVNLGEMDAKLLQKIEELTLYTINQEKAIDELKSIVKAQNEKIEDLISRK